MTESRRVSIRFSEDGDLENFEELEEIAEEGDGNKSEIVREALEDFLYMETAPEHIERKKVSFGENDIEDMEKVIDLGYAVDKGDLIRKSVDYYLNEYK